MRDYFGEFIVSNPGRAAPRFLGSTENKTPIKTHLMWMLAAGGASYAAWKISEWRTSLRLLNQQNKVSRVK